MNSTLTTDHVSLGVDLGSLGCRFALQSRGTTLPVWLPRPFEEQLAQSDHQGSSLVELLTESLAWKTALGHPDSAQRLSHFGADFAREYLRAGWQASQALTPHPIEQTVLVVPASYYARQRQILRQAALDAGMNGPLLVSDSMALAGAWSESQPIGLYVICQCGYSGWEISVIDISPRRLEVLAYRFSDRPCGRELDRKLIEEALAAAFSLQQAADLAKQHPLPLQFASQRLRHQLAHSRTTEIEFHLGEEVVRAELDAARWEQRCRREFAPLGRELRQAVADSRASEADIAGILVAGGLTALPAFQETLRAELSKPLTRLHDWSAANGAAHLASQFASKEFLAGDVPAPTPQTLYGASDLEPPSSGGYSPHRVMVRLPSHSVALAVPSASLNQPQAVPSAATPSRPATEPSPPAPAPPDTEPTRTRRAVKQALAARSLKRARDFLKQRRFQEAVSTSHLAHEEDRDSSELFEAMVEIHLDAAQQNDTPAGYEKAIEWLLCAKSHDPTNPSISQALADRHLLQARQMLKQNAAQQALLAAERAFQLRPDSHEIEHILAQAREAMG